MKYSQQAFPIPADEEMRAIPGMTCRDYMIAQIAAAYPWGDVGVNDLPRVAQFVVMAADAVIEESCK